MARSHYSIGEHGRLLEERDSLLESLGDCTGLLKRSEFDLKFRNTAKEERGKMIPGGQLNVGSQTFTTDLLSDINIFRKKHGINPIPLP